MNDEFSEYTPELLSVGVYVVTGGPFEGRICENDDCDFLERSHFEDYELDLYDIAGVQWKKLRFQEFEGANFEYSDEVGTGCEYVSFGKYIYIGETYVVPQSMLRVANMNDLVTRAELLGNEVMRFGFKVEGYDDQNQLISLLQEWNFILSEIRDREAKALQMKGKKRNIFLCYSSADKPFVRKIYVDLVAAGHTPWMDEFEINVGDSIVEKISEAHETADMLVLFLSRHSVEAAWVKKEWQSALMRQLKSGGIRILPAKLDDCAVPVILSDVKYADFSESYLSGLEALYAGLV